MNSKKIISYLLATLILLFGPVFLTFAQPGLGDPLPCDPDDTTSACQLPIDNYVILLALITIMFTVIHLQRNKKAFAV